MARADTFTAIPLIKIAHHMGINPYHFNSISSDTVAPVKTACDDVWYQYDWQNAGKVSRDNVAHELRVSEDLLWEYLGWSAIPRWYEDEEIQLPEYYKEEGLDYHRNARGNRKSIEARWGYVIEPGKRAKSLISTETITYSDEDGDSYAETATISFATTVTSEDELHVYFPSESGADEWEIRPLDSVTISGGTATIVFKRYLVPLPDLWTEVQTDDDPHIIIDGDVIGNFLTEVDVYRVYTDPSEQCTFYAHPTECNSTNAVEEPTESGALYVKNSRLGILPYVRADWDADTEAFTQQYFTYRPYKVKISYKAGFMDNRLTMPTRQMRNDLERLLVRYAVARIDTELCGCTNTRKIWQKQSEDLSLSADGRSHVLPWESFGNTFGTTLAAFNLWKAVRYLKLSKSPNPN